MNMRRLTTCLGLTLAILLVVDRCTPARGDDPKTTLLLDFDSGKLDRTLWWLNTESPGGVEMDVQRAVPSHHHPHRTGRPPARGSQGVVQD